MTDYAIYQSFAVDASGNVLSGASIEVRSEVTGNLVSLFSGRTGGAKANPFTADADGYFSFYAVGDFMKIRVYTGPSGAPTLEKFFRYVPVGLAGGYDLTISGSFTLALILAGNTTLTVPLTGTLSTLA